MKNSEIFITQKPISSLVAKYIAYYYFHNITEPNLKKSIIFYPNTINALTIYKNSCIVFGEQDCVVRPSKPASFSYLYSGIQKQFRYSNMHSPFDKIGIAFYPLGINAFLKEPLSEIFPQANDKHFNYFNKSLEPVISRVYACEDLTEKVQLLDEYFVAQWHHFKEKTLHMAIQSIHQSEEKLKVQDLAKNMSISQKTLNRKFKKHLNCNVKEYIDIAQFRNSFNHFINHNKSQKLTDLAYAFNYYDQSEFIKQFKKITGINPKKLFKSVERFGKEEVFWNIKK